VAPGGDDYHTVWISPDDSNVLLVAADQGAIVTVNGGQTWSSWYNQPTSQFLPRHHRQPVPVLGVRRPTGGAGSAGVASRGNDGQITPRELAHCRLSRSTATSRPTRLNPDIIFGGKVPESTTAAPARFRTGGSRVGTGADGIGSLRTAPLVFSTVDKKSLYLGANVLSRRRPAEHSWDVISPDLSRPAPEVARVHRASTAPRRWRSNPAVGVI